MSTRDFNAKDITTGLIFAVIGGGAFLWARGSMTVGSAGHMGPGYFPMVVGLLLLLAGVVIVAGAFRGGPTTPFGTVPWRGAILITAAPIAFGALAPGLGLVPALGVTALLSSFASRNIGLLAGLALTAGLTLACLLIFHVGLDMPMELFGPWIAF